MGEGVHEGQEERARGSMLQPCAGEVEEDEGAQAPGCWQGCRGGGEATLGPGCILQPGRPTCAAGELLPVLLLLLLLLLLAQRRLKQAHLLRDPRWCGLLLLLPLQQPEARERRESEPPSLEENEQVRLQLGKVPRLPSSHLPPCSPLLASRYF